MNKILIVDDIELNRKLLAEIFKEQFSIIEALDGEEAIEYIDKYNDELDVIFLDYMMPKKNGLEVLAYMRLNNYLERIPVVMITGEATAESDSQAYEYGAADIIYKPFSSRVIIRRTMNLIEQYKSREKIAAELKQKTEELIESREQLAKTNEFLLEALGSVVEFRNLESNEHIKRVKMFTKIILDYVRSCYPSYGLTAEQVDLMASASALHDVGKIAISDEILKAPRRLTPKEFDEMKKHTTYGCDILDKFKMQQSDFTKYCYDICRWHHEKIDGNGYPDGLVGDEIPIYCQAVSIADCFDALVSKRIYKDPVSCIDSYNMIVNGECGAFSDVIFKCFGMAKLEMFRAIGDSINGVE